MRPSPRWASASAVISFLVSVWFISLVMALVSLLADQAESRLVQSIALIDCNRLNDALGLRAHKIDRQQSVLQVRSGHHHALRQHERALELARGDAAVDVLP